MRSVAHKLLDKFCLLQYYFKFQSCQHFLFSVIYEILHLVSVIVNVVGVNLSIVFFSRI